MAKQNVKNEGDERLESIETTLTKAEQFVIDNQKPIYIALAVLIIAVLAFFGVKKYYLEPREKDAQAAIYHAEQYFENDNFATALNGDGNYLGFVDVINDFGGTKTANLAKYYAGVCCLNTGDFNKAVEYLKANKVVIAPSKAVNAGGVLVSGLEMSQNSERYSWTAEEVDAKLHQIMIGIHDSSAAAAAEYGLGYNLVAGANIAGFLKVADAMLAQGVF